MSGLQILAVVILVAGAVAAAGAGYLLGVRLGATARDALRTDAEASAADAAEARALLAKEVARREDPLRADIERVLSPLLERERLNNELSHLNGRSTHRDLTALLDQIASRGNFAAVVLHDEDGWPLAASANTEDLDRLGATASLLVLLADKLGKDRDTAPLSLMVHNAANHTTLSRLFTVNGQRLSLTVVAAGTPMTPTTLDPALVSITAELAGVTQA